MSTGLDKRTVELAPESRETCDRCGEHVRAIWLVEVGDAGVLTFCGDHFRRYLTAAFEE